LSFSATLDAVSYNLMVSACHGVLQNQKLSKIGGRFHHERLCKKVAPPIRSTHPHGY
jgi:hypothetical protein